MDRGRDGESIPVVVGLAVIGLGAIGRFHAETLARHVPDARLRMVVDQDAELGARVAHELGVRAATAAEEAFADPDVDAVAIAAPTPLHADLIEAAAAAGVHVFCEKPLGVDLARVRAAVAAARGAGIGLQVGFQRRFDAEFRAAKRRIDSGEVGTIQLVRIAHRNRKPPHPGDLTGRLGSIFVDMAVHDFDTAIWLAGSIAEVHAFEQKRNTVTVLRFASGALGVIDNCRHAGYGFECSAEVLGAGSAVRIGVGAHAEDNIERHEAAYREELREFVACVTNGHEPAVGGEDAIAALELALAAERSVA
jgi:myo-inositol 2-dehydrogenase/D-chiro-inositol 1-dehydrogenase